MKKIAVLFIMATFMLASITNAQDVKNSFVKWDVVPDVKKVKISWLKSAMQGNPIAGADVRSSAATYKQVWGDQVYNKVLNAEDNRFLIDQSKGGEINWAVGSDGRAVQSGTLASGVDVILLDGVEIAKWGTNGCFNALSTPKSYTNDGPDQDNDNGTKNITEKQEKILTGGPNNNNNLFIAGKSSNDGLKDFIAGANFRQSAQDHDALVFMAIAKSVKDDCGGCGNTATTPNQVVYTQPSLYYEEKDTRRSSSREYEDDDREMNVNIRHKANAADWINTASNVAGTVFNGINTFRGYRIEGNRNQTTSSYNNRGWWNGQSNTGFQPSNQLGFTSNGNSRVNSFGTTGSSYGTTGSGGAYYANQGSGGNTWNW